jgi:hypothetical protein
VYVKLQGRKIILRNGTIFKFLAYKNILERKERQTPDAKKQRVLEKERNFRNKMQMRKKL